MCIAYHMQVVCIIHVTINDLPNLALVILIPRLEFRPKDYIPWTVSYFKTASSSKEATLEVAWLHHMWVVEATLIYLPETSCYLPLSAPGRFGSQFPTVDLDMMSNLV